MKDYTPEGISAIPNPEDVLSAKSKKLSHLRTTNR
jgi:hypothetical protein